MIANVYDWKGLKNRLELESRLVEMKLNKPFFLYILFVVFVTPLHAAQVYKWVDEDGQVHYGSKPESKDAKEVKIKNKYIDSGKGTPALSTEERVNKQKRFLDAMDAEKKSIENEKKKKREEEEKKIQRCHAARDQLRRYQSSGALYDLDEKGDRILLTKEQYEKAMRLARDRVLKWCN